MVKLNKLVKKIKFCNVFQSGIGLMFSRKKDRALVFSFGKEKIAALHMFFVFYPIDVLFLDRDKIIVEIKHNFRPFTSYIPNKKAKYVIEMPKGKADKLRIGNKIDF